VEAAARQAGVSESTAHRRLHQPDFQRRLQQLRHEMLQRTAGELTAASTEAIQTLLELLKPPAPPAVRLGAARSVLELGIKVREVADLQERVAALELQAAEAQQAG
jgi:hypothetical protein